MPCRRCIPVWYTSWDMTTYNQTTIRLIGDLVWCLKTRPYLKQEKPAVSTKKYRGTENCMIYPIPTRPTMPSQISLLPTIATIAYMNG